MSAAVHTEPPRRAQRPRCYHTPQCPPTGPHAVPVDARTEHGWTLLCNGVTLFNDGSWKAPDEPYARTPVILHVWGATRRDADLAEQDAHNHPSARLWDIDPDTRRTTGGTCGIRRRDADALEQGADFHRAWAIYRRALP